MSRDFIINDGKSFSSGCVILDHSHQNMFSLLDTKLAIMSSDLCRRQSGVSLITDVNDFYI